MNTTYTFLAEADHNGVKTVNAASTNEIELAQIIDQFSLFLKGCGFVFDSLEVHATDPDAPEPLNPLTP